MSGTPTILRTASCSISRERWADIRKRAALCASHIRRSSPPATTRSQRNGRSEGWSRKRRRKPLSGATGTSYGGWHVDASGRPLTLRRAQGERRAASPNTLPNLCTGVLSKDGVAHGVDCGCARGSDWLLLADDRCGHGRHRRSVACRTLLAILTEPCGEQERSERRLARSPVAPGASA